MLYGPAHALVTEGMLTLAGHRGGEWSTTHRAVCQWVGGERGSRRVIVLIHFDNAHSLAEDY